MSADKYQPHALLLPEDAANQEIVNGFLLEPGIDARRLQLLPVAGGWDHVLKVFVSDHVQAMRRFRERLMILLIDFDARENRLEKTRQIIPSDLSDRVFVIGVWTEPEDIKKKKLGSFESFGKQLAKECVNETSTTWSHALLRHNSGEVARLKDRFRSSLVTR